ncbi:PAF acetylhydrolase [Colletotrichum graminicola M1.001]|uniref:1-alkyl-2-acetylglycerophosphocholine esterase n=1 Tax=Colletotrichum graminicola (strain M1.001 / M2 / FGSC 10212) TaxID=645133 RepID=E3QI58_COLGM|nr:PAF acetylhydrolase [Colletotrichum graminicola M1.001]EFQ30673.1 PAF acetylhydrolase [Colletotrichum graminicola M1.001]
MISTLILGALVSATQAVLVSPPTGPYAVSMTVQSLTDSARLDPYAPKNKPHSRQVMISTFLPVDKAKTPCSGWERVPYMTPLVARAYDELGIAVGLPNGTFSAFEMEFCQTRARSCQRSRSKFPLALFSPGWGNPRLLYGAMARDVASHGFAVVTIDHPYDPSFVEFPNGTVYQAVNLDPENTTVRAEDTSFVLSHLHDNPVPGVDLDRTIMFGHSLGGATAAATMLTDSRIRGGINFDGKLINPALGVGLDQPFALVGRPGHIEEDPTWDEFYAGLRGTSIILSVSGTTHASFTDFPVLIASLNLTLPDEARSLLEVELGTLEFGRVGNVVSRAVEAFSHLSLDKQVEALFTKGGDAAFPEVSVQRFSL